VKDEPQCIAKYGPDKGFYVGKRLR